MRCANFRWNSISKKKGNRFKLISYTDSTHPEKSMVSTGFDCDGFVEVHLRTRTQRSCDSQAVKRQLNSNIHTESKQSS